MIAFGFVIIPINYIICLGFSHSDYAFRNQGWILYAFGFMVADAICAISKIEFYSKCENDIGPNYIWMADPFVFYYWT
jgi:hypothetical protein